MMLMFAGALPLRRSLESLVVMAMPPVRRMKSLVERVVSSKGSWSAPVVEIVPVSLTTDMMVLFMMPCLSVVVDMEGL